MPAPRVCLAGSIFYEPGFYSLRLVRKGPVVAAEVSYSDSEGWSVSAGDESQGPSHDPHSMSLMEKVCLWGDRIPESEFRYLRAAARYAVEHKPNSAAANPRRAIDVDTFTPF